VQLVIPLTGLTEDFHLQVILPAPPVQVQRPSRRYAPCLAHQEKRQLNCWRLRRMEADKAQHGAEIDALILTHLILCDA
ncbi:MAG: hypothetical protein M1363_04980, partial [Gammaproteobacteria bacterium]|nr:hypothetical protein [Gammaproteobacteria bacterium]